MNPLPVVNICQADSDVLRDWASSYGAAVRQRAVRQETTTPRHGTLPEFMYQRQCEVSEKPVSITTIACDNHDRTDSDESDEFDESSDEEFLDDATRTHGEIRSLVSFLLGAQSRFGRVVRFNNRLLQ